jgi:peptidoglycan/LPS O-acetylase OafA/YrhL
MSHLKALDGIRGIAILLVMCFHFGYLAPGWGGTDLVYAFGLPDHRNTSAE